MAGCGYCPLPQQLLRVLWHCRGGQAQQLHVLTLVLLLPLLVLLLVLLVLMLPLLVLLLVLLVLMLPLLVLVLSGAGIIHSRPQSSSRGSPLR
jgi:hypothetical protein